MKRFIVFLSVFFLLLGLAINPGLGKATLEVIDLSAVDFPSSPAFNSDLDNSQIPRPHHNFPEITRLTANLLIKVESFYVLKMINSCHPGHSGGIPW